MLPIINTGVPTFKLKFGFKTERERDSLLTQDVPEVDAVPSSICNNCDIEGCSDLE